MNRLVPLLAFALLPLAWRRASPERPEPLAPDRPVASLVPERCAVYLEGCGLDPLFERGLEHPFVAALLASSLGRVLEAALPASPQELIARADGWLGAPLLDLTSDLTRRGLALAVDPAGNKSVLVGLGADGASVGRGLEQLFDAFERQYGWPGGLDRPQRSWSGADVWMLGEACVARREALLVVGNDAELVQEVLELAADPAGRGLLARPGFEASHAARGAGATLWAWLELAEIEAHADQGFRELRAANRSPAAQGLLGAQLAALASAHSLTAELALGTAGLQLELQGLGAPFAQTLVPHARAGAVPAESTGANLASAVLYRDYSHYFTGRSELFPPEALPGFAEAITNGALFFEGMDLGAEVLDNLSPWLRLVVRELQFPAEREPELPLPGAALVAVLEDVRQGEQWLAAFQSIIAIVNVDQAQKGGRAMRLQVSREGDFEVSAARYATPAEGEGIDARYNLEPAIAVVGRHLILGTHQSLVRALVRELAASEPLPSVDARERLELDAAPLRRVLAQNFAHLVARKMLEEGLDRESSEKELHGLRLVLAAFEGAELELEGTEHGTPRLKFALRLTAAPR